MGVFTLNKKIPIPFADVVREFFAERPKDVDGQFASSTIYYKDYLTKLLLGRFEIIGIPEMWETEKLENWMLDKLFFHGFFGIRDTTLGVIPLQCSYSGINPWGRATTLTFDNPVLTNIPDATIGVDGALIHLQYDYGTVWRILNRYAGLLAMCDSLISVSLLNSKVTFIGKARTRAGADTIKAIYDKIASGDPAAVYDPGSEEKDAISFDFNNAKQNFVAPEGQELKRNIINEFLTEIGINTANVEKKARLNLDEVNVNNEERYCHVEHWLRTVNNDFDIANKIFGLNLKFQLKNWPQARAEETPVSENETGTEGGENN